MELVQGEGGVIPADREFVTRVRAVTRELDIPLIVDEVQTGCGRTGTWFAFEQYGIEPDVIIASKGLSGMGLPVALIMYDEKLDQWAPGAHTGTFRGNQLAFAAGTKAIEVIREQDILGTGLNWYLNENLRMMFNYLHVLDVRSSDEGFDGENPDIFQLRAQLDF